MFRGRVTSRDFRRNPDDWLDPPRDHDVIESS
jgi:hypothetical protein